MQPLYPNLGEGDENPPHFLSYHLRRPLAALTVPLDSGVAILAAPSRATGARIGMPGPNPMHVYSEVIPINVNRVYFQDRVDRIVIKSPFRFVLRVYCEC